MMPCTPKRNNLANYHDADIELTMEECTDTDNQENITAVGISAQLMMPQSTRIWTEVGSIYML